MSPWGFVVFCHLTTERAFSARIRTASGKNWQLSLQIDGHSIGAKLVWPAQRIRQVIECFIYSWVAWNVYEKILIFHAQFYVVERAGPGDTLPARH